MDKLTAQIKMPLLIESERLALRMLNEKDYAELYEYYSDDGPMRLTFGEPLSKGESWKGIAAMIGHWHIRGYGPYAIEQIANGKVIGICGLWFPIDWPEPEIVCGLSPAFWGFGYAKEAAIAVRQTAQKFLPRTSLISLVHPRNRRSIRLAESMGAVLEKEIEFRNVKCRLYRHLHGQ